MAKVKYIVFSLLIILTSTSAYSSNDPFDWSLGVIYTKSLYWHESNGGHTIRDHWDKSYSFLNNRCRRNSRGVFSTWRNKNTAYDRMKRTWRRSESSISVQALHPSLYGRESIYSTSLFQSSEFGKIVTCRHISPIRYAAYLSSGTKKTRIHVLAGAGKARLNTGFPIK